MCEDSGERYHSQAVSFLKRIIFFAIVMLQHDALMDSIQVSRTSHEKPNCWVLKIANGTCFDEFDVCRADE